jgi:curved DNA-binding protein CbpA
MAKCKSLYKKLAILAHPDKNPNKSELAQEITMSLNENRYNYAKLKELEKRITKDLL